ncbi:MAG: NUDIX domain-containing protein [Nostocaceae cyanobacterium]|nr:NUDIX domain-containing protein [Nostocaceae cyanobacterium]
MPTTDEIIDIVNEKDIVIGQKKRSEIYLQGMVNFRVVNAFLCNCAGEIWLPRRSASKKIFPLCLDMSMGGHVETGETYEDAFKRELQEELNLELHRVNYHLLGYLTPYKHHVSAFMKVYEISTDTTPDYNRDDFVESFWLKPQAAYNKIQSGEAAKSDLPKLIHIFYLSNKSLTTEDQ